MANEKVTLLDLSFNTAAGLDGLEALIAKSVELAKTKEQLQKAMKEEKKLWNKDGYNSIVIFQSGADSDAKNTHLVKAPLVTAPKDTSRTSGKEEGLARLMLVNAKMNANTLSFDIKGGAIVPGTYQRVRIITECVFQ